MKSEKKEKKMFQQVYIGVADHLWGKHCQRDFKFAQLQEYESWREMYMRMSEEREVKLQRLTKSIVSAHSSKPKGMSPRLSISLNLSAAGWGHWGEQIVELKTYEVVKWSTLQVDR